MQGESELERIAREAERIKEKARDLMLPELFTKLYHNKISHYPSWLKNEDSRKCVCPLVTEAEKLTEKNKYGEDIEKIKIKLKEKEYTFTFRKYDFETPDGEAHRNGKLELYYNDKKILAMTMGFYSQSFDEYDSSLINGWHIPSDVDAFVDGDWVSDFRELARKIRAEDEIIEQNQKGRDESKEIKKLKEDFGIE